MLENRHRLVRVGLINSALLLSLCQCGGTAVSPAGSANGGSGSAGAGGADNSAGAGAIRTTGERSEPLPPPSCPATIPDNGSACSEAGKLCSYGNSARFACRDRARCEGGTWQVDGSGCESTQPATCTAAPSDGASCEANGPLGNALLCSYPGGVLCSCFACDRLSPQYPNCTQGGPTFICTAPPKDLDCPLTAPNAGDGCTAPGTQCVYGLPCGGGATLLCHSGEWELTGVPCSQ